MQIAQIALPSATIFLLEAHLHILLSHMMQ